jgi:serine protease Do
MVAIVSGFFGGWFGSQSQVANNETTITRQIVESEGSLINTIATDVSPSVVSVNVTSAGITQDYFGFGQQVESQSAGTGVILSAEGLIITNRHVVPIETTVVTVTLSSGEELEAEIVGRTNASDPLDIAFLKIKDTSNVTLTPANIGNSDDVKVGDHVVAIGNALGQFQNTVTSGIISGFGRDIEAFDGGGLETLQNLFQTDAAINGGNSGGPLVNSASEVIGINVATASAENISFAIPINDVKGLIAIVLERGKLERPYLGVRYVPLTPDTAEQLDLTVAEGAYIPEATEGRASILANSPAEKAGLQEKDVIIEINGQKLDAKNNLVSILGKSRPDDTVEIKILRGEEEITLSVTLEPAPEQ